MIYTKHMDHNHESPHTNMDNTLDMLKGNLIKSGDNYWFQDDVQYIGLYFSALWCPPCRVFTPKLTEFYRKVTNKGHKLEIVFVSSDHDENSYDEYFSKMPWSALVYSQRELQEKLIQKYNILGFPTLVILDKDGKTVTTKGRVHVMNKTGDEEELTW